MQEPAFEVVEPAVDGGDLRLPVLKRGHINEAGKDETLVHGAAFGERGRIWCRCFGIVDCSRLSPGALKEIRFQQSTGSMTPGRSTAVERTLAQESRHANSIRMAVKRRQKALSAERGRIASPCKDGREKGVVGPRIRHQP